MAVTASFIWGVTSGILGVAPFTVQFTDTSDVPSSEDSADGWNWNFGDGTTSDSQDPSHTYTTNGPFLVTLLTFVTAGSPPPSIPLFTVSRRYKLGSNYANFLAASWTTDSLPGLPSYRKQTSAVYAAQEVTFKFDLTSYPEANNIATLVIKFNPGIDNPESFAIFDDIGIIMPANNNNIFLFVSNIDSSLGGNTLQYTARDPGYPVLSLPIFAGWSISDIRATIQPISSKSSVSDIIGIFSIDFDVSASSGIITSNQIYGNNILNVTFRDLSIVPAGLTYSWQKRNGGGSWTEFSNSQTPPPQNFDKNNP